MTPKSQPTKENVDKLIPTTFETFVHQRTLSVESKSNPQNGGNIHKSYLTRINIQNVQITLTTQQQQKQTTQL